MHNSQTKQTIANLKLLLTFASKYDINYLYYKKELIKLLFHYMTKRTTLILICIFVLAFTVLPTGFCFALDSTDDSVIEFESTVEQMAVIYENYLNEKCDLVTPQYYGLINRGDSILLDNDVASRISASTIDRFRELRCRYYIQKGIIEVDSSVHDSTYSVEIRNVGFYFYPEQWNAVLSVVNDTMLALSSSDEDTNIDAIIDDYIDSLSDLPDKPSSDALRSERVSQSMRKIDFIIVDNINGYLIEATLPIIDKANYINYRIHGDNTDYDEWFSDMASIGYSPENIVKLTLEHQSALNRILNLSVFADKAEYDLIVEDALTVINGIEVNSVEFDRFRLSSIKESALISLMSFFDSEGYKTAGDKLKAEYDFIINNALVKIDISKDADEVQAILMETQNTLADVDEGNDGSELMTVGIVLFVCAVVIAAVFIVIKERNRRERELKTERRNEFEKVEQQINRAIKAEEISDNDKC